MIAQPSWAGKEIKLNVEPAKVFKAGESDWLIPALSQAEIDTQVPSPQLID